MKIIKNFFKSVGALIGVVSIFVVALAYVLWPFIVLGVIIWGIIRITG